MVSQFTGYPVEELKSSCLTVLANFQITIENLYLKLMTRINWLTGKQGNQVTKLICNLYLLLTTIHYSLTTNLIGELMN